MKGKVSDYRSPQLMVFEQSLEDFREQTRQTWREELQPLDVGSFICEMQFEEDAAGITWSKRGEWRKLDPNEPAKILEQIVSTLYISEELGDYDLGRYDHWQTTMGPGIHELIIGVSMRKAEEDLQGK